MNGLTVRQKQVLDFLMEFQRSNGYPPTIRDIRDAFRLKSNRGVVDHLRALERKGYIRRRGRSPRAIEILGTAGAVSAVTAGGGALRYPVAGRIRAGEPATPIEDIVDSILLDERLFGRPGDYLLEVKGESMIDDHILPGDLLLVRREASIENGDIVVALVDGEATVKRFHRRGDTIVLKPANARFEPIVIVMGGKRRCSIAGKVVGLVRRNPTRRISFSG